MASPEVVWKGTPDESLALVNAVAQHCTCTFGAMKQRLTTCAPHKMLTEDQRALDGLLFMRHQADRLAEEESHG